MKEYVANVLFSYESVSISWWHIDKTDTFSYAHTEALIDHIYIHTKMNGMYQSMQILIINHTQWNHCPILLQCCDHDDVIKWKHFPRYWPFVRGIHRSPVNSPHKGQWRGVLMFSLICVWINDWVNSREAGDLRRYRAHYDVIVMICVCHPEQTAVALKPVAFNNKTRLTYVNGLYVVHSMVNAYGWSKTFVCGAGRLSSTGDILKYRAFLWWFCNFGNTWYEAANQACKAEDKSGLLLLSNIIVFKHYIDIIVTTVVSQITSLTVV